MMRAIAVLLSGIVGALGAAELAAAAAQPTITSATVELCAKPGTQIVAGTSVPIWGYAEGDCSSAGEPTLPGPTIVVNAGDVVTITLDNGLSENTSLLFPGQHDELDALSVPDFLGIGPGGERDYTFTASEPGTYLYESGANSARQVPMGLHGALIARSSTAYDVEATLVLSEIDPALNGDPTGFNPGNYVPRYSLINGEAYPDTDLIIAAAGEDVMLRLVNAGLDHHTMATLGAHQRIIAKDAQPEPHPFWSIAETVASGQTVDAITTMPAGVTRIPLYERQMRVVNGSSYPGGMLTFLQVP